MTVTVLCPNPRCGLTNHVPVDRLGRSWCCPYCGQEFLPPATQDESPFRSARQTHDPSGRPTLDEPRPGILVKGKGQGRKEPAGPAPAPRCVGRFLIRALLGSGAFGEVYRAYDPQLDRDVALKLPQPGVLKDPRRGERFRREARAAAQLRHPNIVPVYDAGQDGEQFYIASAFIDGRTLKEALDGQRFDHRQAAQLVRELADGLAYTHELNIVHRDVKPANVLLDVRGRPLVMDFGLASRYGLPDPDPTRWGTRPTATTG